MGAVAVGPVVRSLAAAQVHRPRGWGDKTQRLKTGKLVGTITEGLLGRTPADAPEVGPAFDQLHLVGALLRTDRLVGHGHSSVVQTRSHRRADRAVGAGAGGPPPAGQVTLSLIFSTTLLPPSSTQVNSNSPGPGTFMKNDR